MECASATGLEVLIEAVEVSPDLVSVTSTVNFWSGYAGSRVYLRDS